MNVLAPPSTSTRPVRTAIAQPGSLAFGILALAWIAFAPDYWIFTVSAAVPLSVAALGLLVLQGWSREISLATAGLFATAMYVFGLLNRPDNVGRGIPWVIAALLTLALVAGLMAAVAAVSVRLPGIYLIVLTLGLQTTIEKVVFTEGNLSGGISGGTERQEPIVNPRPYFFGLDLSGDTGFYLFLLGWLAVVLAFLVRLRHSPAGLAMFLVGDDRQAASAVGISPLRYRVAAYVLSGVLAGVGGVLACWLFISAPVFVGYMAPTSLLLLAVPVLAGLDSIAWVVGIATAFHVIPVALEGWRINVFLMSGVGLLAGAALGARGVGGRIQDHLLRRRRGDRRARTAAERPSAERLRLSTGLADDQSADFASDRRQDALAVLEAWLPPRAGGDVAVRVRDARIRLGGVQALDGVDLDVRAGSMTGLIGPNGAGKSTLFDVVGGTRTPQSGTVELLGVDATGLPAWRRSRLGMARTFQTARVIDDLTVADNILAGARARIPYGSWAFLAGSRLAWAALAEAERAAWAAAVLLGVDRYWDERAGTLEFSARRRAELARCLVSGPRLLLLDEPAAGLDPAASTAMLRLLRALHDDLGLTVLLVEHYVTAVLDTCDQITVLAEGVVLTSGTPEEILAHPAVRDRYLGRRIPYAV